MAKRKYSMKPDGKFRFFTIREALILLGVALVIFLILMDKPYSNDSFSTVRPFLWKTADIDETAVSFVSSLKTSEDAALAPRVVIQDITEQAKDYETAEDYVKARVAEEQLRPGFIFYDVGPFKAGNGMDAYFFAFTAGGGETSSLKIIEVTFKSGDRTYMIAYRAIITRFDKFSGAAERIMHAFKLKK